MHQRRWPRVLAWSLIGLIFVVGASVFAIAKRPATTPTYPADAWTGQGTVVAGWLVGEEEGGTICWVVDAGRIDDPDSRTGLVLPDTYRSFAPALIDRGSGDPVPFISGTRLWAPPPIATARTEVSVRASLADGDARAAWDDVCGGIVKVNAVATVKPGSLAPTPPTAAD